MFQFHRLAAHSKYLHKGRQRVDEKKSQKKLHSSGREKNVCVSRAQTSYKFKELLIDFAII